MCRSHKPKTPELQKIDPAVTNVTGQDIADPSGELEAANKRRNKRGFTATQLSTLMSLVGGGGKDTLG